MREDLLEQLEKAYPEGFIFLYLDNKRKIRLSGSGIDKSSWLTSFYHMALALSSIIDSHTHFQDDIINET